MSDKLILAAGGKTYPALGSNGSGYALAESLGHNLITPVPSALPLEAQNPLAQLLQGQRMETQVTSIIAGEEIKTRTDDMMFTKYGLSGPVILNISREISIHINRHGLDQASLKLNFLPGEDFASAKALLQDRWNKRPDQQLLNSLYGLFPNKFAQAILQTQDLNPELVVSDLADSQINTLVEAITNYQVPVTGTRGWNEAEFTAGGVDTQDVYHSTLISKKLQNLYFAGEVLDVDGDVGGFNLSWSWASGWVAGKLQT